MNLRILGRYRKYYTSSSEWLGCAHNRDIRLRMAKKLLYALKAKISEIHQPILVWW